MTAAVITVMVRRQSFRLQIRAFQRSAARHRISQRSQHQHQRHPERRNGKGNGRIQLYAL
ncbi:MAG: hypothetical protein ACLUOF_07150 [Ruminococcus sp.]